MTARGPQTPDAALMVNDTPFDNDYEPTSKAVGSQQWVANEWARMKLPTHEKYGDACHLMSGTRNFIGKQYRDGSGKLVHYSTTEAVRTLSGFVVSNTECYAKGWAHCSTPSTTIIPSGKRSALPLTTLNSRHNDFPDWQKIVNVEGADSYDRDWHGYDRLVEFRIRDASVFYAANRDEVVDEPLDKREANELLEEIQG